MGTASRLPRSYRRRPTTRSSAQEHTRYWKDAYLGLESWNEYGHSTFGTGNTVRTTRLLPAYRHRSPALRVVLGGVFEPKAPAFSLSFPLYSACDSRVVEIRIYLWASLE